MFKSRGYRRRLSRALLGAVAAVAALTCQSSTSFHLLETGDVDVAVDVPPTQLVPAGLAQVDLGKHPMMQRQALAVADLRQLRPYAATLSVAEPATGEDLSFLGQLNVVVSAPNLADKVVASGQGFATGTNSVGLDVEDVELLAYVRTKKMAVTLQVSGASVAPTPLKLHLALVLAAQVAQPRGACN